MHRQGSKPDLESQLLRYRVIRRLRYDEQGNKVLTFREIGKLMGVTSVRVRQLYEQGKLLHERRTKWESFKREWEQSI